MLKNSLVFKLSKYKYVLFKQNILKKGTLKKLLNNKKKRSNLRKKIEHISKKDTLKKNVKNSKKNRESIPRGTTFIGLRSLAPV